VKELIADGAEVNAPDMGPILTEEQKARHAVFTQTIYQKISGDYPLHIAAAANFPGIISALFYAGAKMEYTNRVGSTALHRAVSCGHIESVQELLKHGADIRAQNTMGMTPLHLAAASSNIPMIKLLLGAGADADLKTVNKVYMAPIEYTVRNSKTRQFFLELDPTLRDCLTDEIDEKEQENDDDMKENV
jgi:ankyrin repeat protein